MNLLIIFPTWQTALGADCVSADNAPGGTKQRFRFMFPSAPCSSH